MVSIPSPRCGNALETGIAGQVSENLEGGDFKISGGIGIDQFLQRFWSKTFLKLGIKSPSFQGATFGASAPLSPFQYVLAPSITSSECLVGSDSDLRGPAAILFISRDTCSDSIANLFRACFCGVSHSYRTICCKMGYRTDVSMFRCPQMGGQIRRG